MSKLLLLYLAADGMGIFATAVCFYSWRVTGKRLMLWLAIVNICLMVYWPRV